MQLLVHVSKVPGSVKVEVEKSTVSWDIVAKAKCVVIQHNTLYYNIIYYNTITAIQQLCASQNNIIILSNNHI